MINLVELMLEDGLLKKEDIAKLVRMRPPKKASLENIINEKILDESKVEKFLAKKIRQGALTLAEAETIEGIDMHPIFRTVASALNIPYLDMDEVEIDMHLFSKVPYQQLTRHNVLPIEETDLNILVAFQDPLDMAAQDAIQRLFPRKPISVALASPKKISTHLQRLEITQSIKGLIDEIRKDLREGEMRRMTRSLLQS